MLAKTFKDFQKFAYLKTVMIPISLQLHLYCWTKNHYIDLDYALHL